MLDHTSRCHFLVQHTTKSNNGCWAPEQNLPTEGQGNGSCPHFCQSGGNGAVSLQASTGVLFPLRTK